MLNKPAPPLALTRNPRRAIKSGLAPAPKLSYGSYSWCGGRAVECGGLLNRCTGKTVPGVRIPPAPVFPFRLSFSTTKYHCEFQSIPSSLLCAIEAVFRSKQKLVRLCSFEIGIPSRPAKTPNDQCPYKKRCSLQTQHIQRLKSYSKLTHNQPERWLTWYE